MDVPEKSFTKLTFHSIRDWDAFQAVLRLGLENRQKAPRQEEPAPRRPVLRSRKETTLALVLALWGVVPVAATSVQAKEPVPVMEEVVVSATRTGEMRKDVAKSVEIIDRQEIDEAPAAGIGDLLATRPGIDWRTRGDFGGAAQEIHIRGMRGDETQVLVNGVSYNSPSLGSADVGKLPNHAIERIEVVKGSGSVLYGSGAMAGTAHMETKRPEPGVMALSLGAGYGSNAAYDLALENGTFLSDWFGYYLTASKSETDGFRENSDLDHRDATLNLLFKRGDVLEATLYGDHVERKFGVPGTRPPQDTPSFAMNGVTLYNASAASLVDRGEDEDSHLVFHVRNRPLAWLTLNAQADYTRMENFLLTRYNTTGDGFKTWVTNEIKQVEAYAEIRPVAMATLVAGADYTDMDWDNDNLDLDAWGNDKNGTSRTATANLFTKSMYGELRVDPCRHAKAFAGLRQETHSTFGREMLPVFGITLNPLAATTVKMSHGKHFKAPTPNDLFWPEDLLGRGNPDLRAQTGWHTDLTLEQNLINDTLFFTGSYFNWDVDDKIDWGGKSCFSGAPRVWQQMDPDQSQPGGRAWLGSGAALRTRSHPDHWWSVYPHLGRGDYRRDLTAGTVSEPRALGGRHYLEGITKGLYTCSVCEVY